MQEFFNWDVADSKYSAIIIFQIMDGLNED